MSFGSWVRDLFRNASPETASPTDMFRLQPRAQVPFGRLPNGRYSRSATGSKWDFGLSANGQSPYIDNATSRQNSRSAYIDSVQFHALINRFADTVVDRGLMSRPAPVATVLGLDEEYLAEWSEDCAERFHAWAMSPEVDVAGRLNFYQYQRLFHLCDQRDGELFIRFHYGAYPGLVNPVQIQLVDPNEIRGTAGYTTTTGFGRNLDAGIERDKYGRETAYHFYVYDGQSYTDKTIPARLSNGLPLVQHVFRQEWPDQVRGYPHFTHALQEFENLTDFSLAHIKKAINQSQITMFVEPSDDSPASDPFEGITQSGSGPAEAQLVADAQAPGVASDLGDRFEYIPIHEATMNAPGSTAIVGLDSGEKLKAFVDSSPGANYDKFVDAFTAHLAASGGMPVEVLLQRFNQNYSASRAALLLFWRVAQLRRDEMASDILNPVRNAWLYGEIAAGRIIAPGYSDPVMRSAWNHVEWVGAPMPNIDPNKTAQADMAYVEMGAQTLANVAHNFSGTSFKRNKTQLAREYENLETPPWATPTSANSESEKTDSDDDETEGN